MYKLIMLIPVMMIAMKKIKVQKEGVDEYDNGDNDYYPGE